MSLRNKILSVFCVLTLALAGCGGSGGDDSFSLGNGDGDFGGGGSSDSSGGSSEDSSDDSSSDDSGGGSGSSGSGTSSVSYLPLSVYEAFSAYSGFSADGLFQGDGSAPFISEYLINPVSASNLAPVTDAVTNDYVVTIDSIEIDASESFPILQKVIGTPVTLRTALVFDVSDSTDSVDIAALVTEAKAYVAAAQASANEIIAEQEFVVWAFGQSIEELTSGFTSNTAAVETALDLVETRFNSGALGTSSNLHRAVVEVIGRFSDDTYDFSVDGDNDLVDTATDEGVELSQMAVFSSGPDTFLEMTADLMANAISSQSFLVYDTSSSDNTATTFLKKPVFYYVVGDEDQGTVYENLSTDAEALTYLTLSAGAYSFSDDLIQEQIDAIEARIDLDNQYMYRYAFLPRIGDHEIIFTSNSSGYNYSLTSSYAAADLLPFAALGTPEEELASLVEITGPEGEFLSNGEASLAEVSTFGFATRWTNTTYGAGDYSWSLPAGSATLTVNGDGTATISAKTTSTVTLRLTNTIRGESADIVISD
ncbi:MAG: hypothetical protein C9356_07490 [Oleiphilus sp.]|nr:MAG: hypothetical protein C9356_07490 [Oleiphilus sp.]